eukprot:g18564.t1
MEIAFANARGYTDDEKRLEDRLKNCEVVEIVDPVFEDESEESGGLGTKKMAEGQRRDKNTVSPDEMSKIREQVEQFRKGIPPETSGDVMRMRRLSAILPQAVKEQIAAEVEGAWCRGEIPVLRIESDASSLGMLLPSPVEREFLRGGGRTVLDPSAKFLVTLVSVQSLSQGAEGWRLSPRISAAMPIAILPSDPKLDEDGEEKKKIAGEETGKITRIILEQLHPILHYLFNLPNPPQAAKDLPRGAAPPELRSLLIDLMTDAGGSTVPTQRLCKESSAPMRNLMEPANKPAAANPDPKADGGKKKGKQAGKAKPKAKAKMKMKKKNALELHSDMEELWEDEGNGGNGEASIQEAEQNGGSAEAAAGGDANAKSKPKKKPGRARDYYSQYSFSFNRLINHQRRSLLQNLARALEQDIHVAVTGNKEIFEQARALTQSILVRHGLWDAKKNGPIHYAISDQKVWLLDIPGDEHAAPGKTVADQLCYLIPATRPGSETRWWSIQKNSGLAVGFGMMRFLFKNMRMAGVHIGGGEYTPDSFGVSVGLTTLLDFSLLSHLTQTVSDPATALSATTYSKARIESRAIDLGRDDHYRGEAQRKKFLQIAADSLNRLRPLQYEKEALVITGGDGDAVEYHKQLRVHALGGVLRAVGGYYWRFGEHEAHHMFLLWLVRACLKLQTEEEQEAKLEEMLRDENTPFMFRTKNLDLIEVGTVSQLRDMITRFGRAVALRMAQAQLALLEIGDSHSIRAEFHHQRVQSCQQPNGTWCGDKAVNSSASQSFVRRVLAEKLEQTAAKQLDQIELLHRERLQMQGDYLAFTGAREKQDVNQIAPGIRHRAYISSRVGDEASKLNVEKGGTQKEYQKGKQNLETVREWLDESIEMCERKIGDRLGTIAALEDERAKVLDDIARRDPAEAFWNAVVDQLPDLAAEVPLRRVREFEQNTIWDTENKGVAGPIMSVDMRATYEADLDFPAPTELSAAGRFVCRILAADAKTRKQDPAAAPRYVAVELQERVYVVAWSMGKPAGFVALALPPSGLGKVDLLEMLNPENVKALISYDAEMEKRSDWHFFWVTFEEHPDGYREDGVIVDIKFEKLIPREEHFAQEDREAAAAEKGEYAKGAGKSAKAKAKAAPAFIDQTRMWKKRYALQRKLRKARKLTRKELRDKKLEIEAKHAAAHKRAEGMARVLFEETMEQLLEGIALETADDFAKLGMPICGYGEAGDAGSSSGNEDDGEDSSGDDEINSAGEIGVASKSGRVVAKSSAAPGPTTPAQLKCAQDSSGRRDSVAPSPEDIKFAAEFDYFSSEENERSSRSNNAGAPGCPNKHKERLLAQGLYEKYRKRVETEKAQVDITLGGFQLVYRGSAKAFAAGTGSGRQLQAKPIAGTAEGDATLMIHVDKNLRAREIAHKNTTSLPEYLQRPSLATAWQNTCNRLAEEPLLDDPEPFIDLREQLRLVESRTTHVIGRLRLPVKDATEQTKRSEKFARIFDTLTPMVMRKVWEQSMDDLMATQRAALSHWCAFVRRMKERPFPAAAVDPEPEPKQSAVVPAIMEKEYQYYLDGLKSADSWNVVKRWVTPNVSPLGSDWDLMTHMCGLLQETANICSAKQGPQFLAKLTAACQNLDKKFLSDVLVRCFRLVCSQTDSERGRKVLGRVVVKRRIGVDPKVMTSTTELVDLVEEEIAAIIAEKQAELELNPDADPNVDGTIQIQMEAMESVLGAFGQVVCCKQFTTMTWEGIGRWMTHNDKIAKHCETLMDLKAQCIDTKLTASEALTDVFNSKFVADNRPIPGVRGPADAYDLFVALRPVTTVHALRASDEEERLARTSADVVVWWQTSGNDGEKNWQGIDIRDIIAALFKQSRDHENFLPQQHTVTADFAVAMYAHAYGVPVYWAKHYTKYPRLADTIKSLAETDFEKQLEQFLTDVDTLSKEIPEVMGRLQKMAASCLAFQQLNRPEQVSRGEAASFGTFCNLVKSVANIAYFAYRQDRDPPMKIPQEVTNSLDIWDDCICAEKSFSDMKKDHLFWGNKVKDAGALLFFVAFLNAVWCRLCMATYLEMKEKMLKIETTADECQKMLSQQRNGQRLGAFRRYKSDETTELHKIANDKRDGEKLTALQENEDKIEAAAAKAGSEGARAGLLRNVQNRAASKWGGVRQARPGLFAAAGFAPPGKAPAPGGAPPGEQPGAQPAPQGGGIGGGGAGGGGTGGNPAPAPSNNNPEGRNPPPAPTNNLPQPNMHSFFQPKPPTPAPGPVPAPAPTAKPTGPCGGLFANFKKTDPAPANSSGENPPGQQQTQSATTGPIGSATGLPMNTLNTNNPPGSTAISGPGDFMSRLGPMSQTNLFAPGFGLSGNANNSSLLKKTAGGPQMPFANSMHQDSDADDRFARRQPNDNYLVPNPNHHYCNLTGTIVDEKGNQVPISEPTLADPGGEAVTDLTKSSGEKNKTSTPDNKNTSSSMAHASLSALHRHIHYLENQVEEKKNQVEEQKLWRKDLEKEAKDMEYIMGDQDYLTDESQQGSVSKGLALSVMAKDPLSKPMQTGPTNTTTMTMSTAQTVADAGSELNSAQEGAPRAGAAEPAIQEQLAQNATMGKQSGEKTGGAASLKGALQSLKAAAPGGIAAGLQFPIRPAESPLEAYSKRLQFSTGRGKQPSDRYLPSRKVMKKQSGR